MAKKKTEIIDYGTLIEEGRKRAVFRLRSNNNLGFYNGNLSSKYVIGEEVVLILKFDDDNKEIVQTIYPKSDLIKGQGTIDHISDNFGYFVTSDHHNRGIFFGRNVINEHNNPGVNLKNFMKLHDTVLYEAVPQHGFTKAQLRAVRVEIVTKTSTTTVKKIKGKVVELVSEKHESLENIKSNILTLIRESQMELNIDEFERDFHSTYGYSVPFEQFGCISLVDFLANISDIVEIFELDGVSRLKPTVTASATASASPKKESKSLVPKKHFAEQCQDEGIITYQSPPIAFVWSKNLGKVFLPQSEWSRNFAIEAKPGIWIKYYYESQTEKEGCVWIARRARKIDKHTESGWDPKMKRKQLLIKDVFGMITYFSLAYREAVAWNEEVGRVMIDLSTSEFDWKQGKSLVFVKMHASQVNNEEHRDIQWLARMAKILPGDTVQENWSYIEVRATFKEVPRDGCAILTADDNSDIFMSYIDYHKRLKTRAMFKQELIEKKAFRVLVVPNQIHFHLLCRWRAIFVEPLRDTKKLESNAIFTGLLNDIKKLEPKVKSSKNEDAESCDSLDQEIAEEIENWRESELENVLEAYRPIRSNSNYQSKSNDKDSELVHDSTLGQPNLAHSDPSTSSITFKESEAQSEGGLLEWQLFQRIKDDPKLWELIKEKHKDLILPMSALSKGIHRNLRYLRWQPEGQSMICEITDIGNNLKEVGMRTANMQETEVIEILANDSTFYEMMDNRHNELWTNMLS